MDTNPVAPEGYALVRQIGRGASSVVWEARALATDAAVALKILDTDVAGSDALRTFARERDAMTALVQHPNILTILAADVHDGRPYLAMELCRRGSLSSYVADGGPLDVPTVLRVLERLAGALEVAHEAGVLHCDIKPANVMLTDEGEPALGDFGIARVSVTTATTTAGAAFTLDHVAPELLDEGRRSPRSDVYSLGTTAWQLLVGVPPFRQSDDVSVGTVLTRILRRPLPEHEAVPDDVLALLRTMTAKDPEERPASMAEVGAAVRALAQERGVDLTDAALPPMTSLQLQLIEILSARSTPAAPVTASAPAAPATEVAPLLPDVPATYVPPAEGEPATVLVASGGAATVLQPSELVEVPLTDSLPPAVMPIYERPATAGSAAPRAGRRVPLVAASVVAVLVVAGAVFGLHRSAEAAPEPPAPTPVAVETPSTTTPPTTTTTATPTPTTTEPVAAPADTPTARAKATRTRTTATRRPVRRTAVPAPVPAPAPPVTTTDDPTPDPDTTTKPKPPKTSDTDTDTPTDDPTTDDPPTKDTDTPDPGDDGSGGSGSSGGPGSSGGSGGSGGSGSSGG